MSKVKPFQHYKEESIVYDIDWNVRVGKIGTTVSSVTWTTDSGNATISGESLTGNVASAQVTTNSSGCSVIKAKATFADGQIDVHFFTVKVDEPTCSSSGNSNY